MTNLNFCQCGREHEWPIDSTAVCRCGRVLEPMTKQEFAERKQSHERRLKRFGAAVARGIDTPDIRLFRD